MSFTEVIAVYCKQHLQRLKELWESAESLSFDLSLYCRGKLISYYSTIATVLTVISQWPTYKYDGLQHLHVQEDACRV
jgi:hypothetical protein